MASSSETRTEGKIDEAKGRVKSAAGDLTGDQKLKSEGMLDQASGKVKQGLADAKDKVDETVRRAKDN